MPIQPPPTLDELADEAQSKGEQAVAARFKGPVLVIVAPDEDAAPLTAVTPGAETAFRKQMLPPFVVEVKKGGKFKVARSVKKNVTSVTITGLAAGKSYTFRVKAKKGTVSSDASESVTVQTN